jgi:hypothetical protein
MPPRYSPSHHEKKIKQILKIHKETAIFPMPEN